jgi:hypothetical protein
MIKLSNPKSYSLVTGIILFALGVLGFAFRSSFIIPDVYLLASLVLGGWGIAVGSKK